MAFKKSFLDKPASGWKHDLPRPNQSPSVEPYPPVLSNPPNHANHIYLELARSRIRTRGVVAWSAIYVFAITIIFSIFSTYFTITTAINHHKSFDLLIVIFNIIAIVTGIWIGLYYWRLDTESPRDEPIRFNRARRKVYVYRFHYDGLRPFSRSAWGIRAEVYDWDNLHAEACRVYGPMGTGGVIEAVTLAVLEPGTNKVLDRFHFAHSIQQGEMYWAMAQLFMQQGPHALPTFEYLPRDWNNEDVSYNLALRLAPKVKWPHAMDLESRTAP